MLRTLSPLEFTNIATSKLPFDLHVLSTPPAFVLSQNQTLREKFAPNQAIRFGKFLTDFTAASLLPFVFLRGQQVAGFVRSLIKCYFVKDFDV